MVTYQATETHRIIVQIAETVVSPFNMFNKNTPSAKKFSPKFERCPLVRGSITCIISI